MNVTESSHEPDSGEDVDAGVFFHNRARQSGFTNLFDWFISRQETDDIPGLLFACHAHVSELIDEINDDESSIGENVQYFRSEAREIGFDKLMDLFLHGNCPDCAEGEMFAAESYINELIEEVTKRNKIAKQRE
jgi:hypothetical protein